MMDVSENSGFSFNHPLINRVFHYKPSNLGYPYFRKHPYILAKRFLDFFCIAASLYSDYTPENEHGYPK